MRGWENEGTHLDIIHFDPITPNNCSTSLFHRVLLYLDIDESDEGKLIDPTVSLRDTWSGKIQ